jgi:hypothetical protein
MGIAVILLVILSLYFLALRASVTGPGVGRGLVEALDWKKVLA